MQPDILNEAVQPALKELETVWDYIGYTDEQKSRQLSLLADSIRHCALNFLSEENGRREQLEATVESRKRKVAAVCRSLRLPPHLPPRHLPTLQLLQHLDEHLEQFAEQIRQRRVEFADARQEIRRLCRQLELETQEVDNEEDNDEDNDDEKGEEFVPSERQLQEARDRLRRLRQRTEEAAAAVGELRDDIRRIAADIDYLPETQLETQLLDSRQEVSDLPLSDRTIADLQAWRLRLVKHKAMLVGTCDELRQHVTEMWHRLGIPSREQKEFLEQHSGYRPSTLEALQEESDKCQQLKWAQLPNYIRGLKEEEAQLAARCFEKLSPPSNPDDSEEAAAELELRVEHLRQQLSRNRDLYDAVQQYQATWAAFVEVEQRLKDPAIFSNRGGILLKTEKERKHLAKELPRVESKVSEQLQRLDAGGDFKIGGRTFREHVRHLWDEFNCEKEAAKANRKLSRAPTLDDSRHGNHSRESSANPPASPRRSLARR